MKRFIIAVLLLGLVIAAGCAGNAPPPTYTCSTPPSKNFELYNMQAYLQPVANERTFYIFGTARNRAGYTMPYFSVTCSLYDRNQVKIGESAHYITTRTPEGESAGFNMEIPEREVTGGFPRDFTCSCTAK